MYIIKNKGTRLDGIKRINHTRWGINIPLGETKIDDLQKFFKTKRSVKNIVKNIKKDPCLDIVEVKA